MALQLIYQRFQRNKCTIKYRTRNSGPRQPPSFGQLLIISSSPRTTSSREAAKVLPCVIYVNHLWKPLNTHSQISQDQGAMAFRHMDKGHQRISNTFILWKISPFKNGPLNRLWKFFPGLLLQGIWKERNQQVFQSIESFIAKVYTIIQKQIEETIRYTPLIPIDLKYEASEAMVQKNWNINITHLPLLGHFK